MQGPTIVLSEVGLELGGNQILESISCRFDAGKVHAIIGPNGGGKTSLMLAILGQMPHNGSIVLEGGREGAIGYAPQSLEFDRTLPLTVGDIMAVMNQRRPAFLGRVGGRADWQRALEAVGLGAMRDRRFGALSGGERQRVLLAQAITPRPRLLILDEPTSNMDGEAMNRTEGIVENLRQQGTTVLWVNHDWDQVRRVADTVTMINLRLQGQGEPAHILPAMPEVALS
jgi:zinc transport system ATP-binding protein